MKYAHLLSRFTGSFWLIREESLVSIARLLESRINGGPLPAPIAPPAEEPPRLVSQLAQRGTALIEVSGILGKRLSMMESMCGGCDYDAVVEEVEAALANPAFTSAIIRFDSVGGQVVGCREAHNRLVELIAASGKPVIAYTDTECCSGAYWLAAACDAIYATPSAVVGSTGAKLVWREQSAQNAAEGVKFHVFKSGSMKDILSPYRAPTEEEAKLLQGRADRIGAEFRADVLSHRPHVAAEAFETAMFYDGSEAVALGLVDGVVPHIMGALAELPPHLATAAR